MTADGTNRVAGAGGVNSQKVEGSLDIFWENYLEPTATPTFKIHFLKYLNSINGAQQSKTIVGAANLVVYFMELGFTPEDANHWVAQVNEKKSVSIPNVMLASQHAIAYERPT